jgi:hypothetical protein
MKRLLLVVCMLSTGSLCWAQSAPPLGSAQNFAVLGGTNVTCTASPVGSITGDVGVSPGVPPPFTNTGCAIAGTVHVGDLAAQNARTDFLAAYALLEDDVRTPCTQNILTAAFTNNSPVLGPLPPGVYCFAAAVAFTDTTLTLDGSTNPNGIWIFKVEGALAGSGFQVVLANGAQACNVFWVTDAAVALTTSTLPPLFQGNILAGDSIGGSITITGGALVGRIFANVAVTMTNTNINGVCALVDQAKAGCKNDDDDRDKDHHDRDDDRDRDHHEKDKHHHDRDDKDKDRKDRD